MVSHFNVTTAALNTQTGNFKVKCTYPYYSRGHQIQRKLRQKAANLELAAFYANRGAAYECLERLNKEQVKELGFVWKVKLLELSLKSVRSLEWNLLAVVHMYSFSAWQEYIEIKMDLSSNIFRDLTEFTIGHARFAPSAVRGHKTINVT